MGTVLALGNFDGLHIGHMKVINATNEMAKRLHAMPFALVFKEHPVTVLTGEPQLSLFSPDMRAAVFKQTGVTLCLLDFETMKDMSPREFFDTIILKRMGAKGVCCGFNYTFGKNGEGTPEILEEFCREAGIEFSMSEELDFEGAPVSSTRIREAIENGEIELANVMLGRPFAFRQTVVDGDKRGRAMGTPTINQVLDPGLVHPKYGVYMSKTLVAGRTYYSLTDIGVRPTVYNDGEPVVETHILDFNGNLYGKLVEVHLMHYIRPEKKFESINELEAQIKEDEREVRHLAAAFGSI